MKLALIRADGNSIIGMGHLTRCIDIAKELQKKKYQIIFLTKDFREAISILENNNFTIYKLNPAEDDYLLAIEAIDKIINEYKSNFDIIISDILKNFDNHTYLDKLKKYCNKLVVLSDCTKPFYINADYVFAISQNQIPEYYKDVDNAKYYTGLKYFPLNENFQKIDKKIIKKEVSNILLTFGGSDPQNYSKKVIEILKDLKLKARITLIIGPGYLDSNYTNLIIDINKNIRVLRNEKDMIKHFINMDLCLCSAGNILVELLTCGVPCLILPQTERENEHAKSFEEKKMVLNMGLNFIDEDLISKLKEFIQNYSMRKNFSENAQNYLDGKGLKHIIEVITDSN